MNRSRRPLSFVVSVAMVVGLLVFPVAGLGPVASVGAAGPVSGAIGLGGGLSGSVDERTGLFSVAVPVVSVGGPGSAGVTWSLVWDQGRAVDRVDRSGFGAGWSLGVSFINPETPVTVYPANGGAYTAGGTYQSGLVNYPLQDLEFRRDSGGFPFELLYDDGRVDSFDVNGNLVARTDRFGNRTTLMWEAGGEGVWRPTSIVDGYGLETRFTYVGESSVEVTAPARSDGVVASTTIALDDERRVTSVKDPAGAMAQFEYSPVAGTDDDVELLTTVLSPSQARTHVAYQSFEGQAGLTAVQSVVTTDADGTVMGPARLFSMNPPENVDDHNYTGHPRYGGGTTDGLFVSGDADYFYTTAISSCVVTEVPPPETCPGSPLSTVSTYDSQHRLVERTVKAGEVTVQHQTSTYVAVRASDLDPNYARPRGTSVTYQATSGPDGVIAAGAQRTVESSRVYDGHGRVTSSTDETGTTSTVTYDEAFGLITGVSIVGADGSRSVTSHTLSDDHKTIVGATTSYAAPGQSLSARSTTSYAYDTTTGDLLRRTMRWAPGTVPDVGGPATAVTTFDSAVDAGARTRTMTTTTAVGTSAEAASVTVLDLVTGQPVRNIDPLGRVTSYLYDDAGRQVSRTTPDGLTTTSTFTRATATTAASRTDSTPDGRVVLTTYDVLGRKVRVTDNVQDQAFTDSPTIRQVSAFDYSLEGTTLTATDQHGRTIHTLLDVLGRQVSQVGATGLTHTTIYDDAAHTITKSVVPDGASVAEAVRTTSYDNGNRPVTVQRDYNDGTVDPTQAAAFDGLGRVTSQTSDDVTLEYSYLGAGGGSTTQTATPQDPGTFPGDPLDLSNTIALGGQQTSSSRQAPDGTAFEGTALTYDPAARIATSTDPNGRITSYTYHPDGRVATRTTPSGTVVTDTYDATTGRLVNVTAQPSTGSSVSHTYTYVPAGEPGAGRVHTISDGTNTVTLAYDADGHVVSRGYSDGTATSAAYTDTGLLATTTDVTGAVTTYHYDDAGRMTTVTQTRGDTTLAEVTYTYDSMSRIATTTRGNGITTTNTWTPRNQLATQRTTTATAALIEAHGYTYDRHGNVARRTDTLPAAPNQTAGTWTTAYRYDAYNRLLGSVVFPGAAASGTPSRSTTYTLNTAGDVVGVATTGGSTTSNTIDGAGQLTAQTVGGSTVNQSFDDEGRVTQSLNGSTMSYDPFDRMVAASRGATSATYSYWPDGTRRSITTATTAQPGAVCEQAIAQAGTGQGVYGGYRLVQAPAVGRSGSQVVVGTAGADRLMGGSGNDVLCGLGGNDTLDAGSGNDVLDGGDGDDTLQAGSGNDDLDGAGGFDQLFGNSGNDVLRNGEVNDGGSGRNQIDPPPLATTTQTFHYGPDGTLVNDTTADTTTGDTATTASYLLTAGREARTLQPGTTTVGTVPARAPAPVTTGPGTGYLLRDRHSSVTALIDNTAAVTTTYGYGDYGLPALPDGQPAPAPAVAPGGRTNPFQYTGAAPNSSMTDPTTGLLLLPARSYDPTQGRFTSRDTANVFNKYQGFSTNPIINVDPTGHFSLEDLLLDIGMAIVFAVAAVATAGAAVAALPALVAGEAAAVTTTAIITTVATAVTAVASATGAVASAIKAADDIDDAVTGKHFLTNDQRNTLSTVQAVAGAVSAASGLTAMGGTLIGIDTATEATQDAADFLPDTANDDPDVLDKRKALIEGENNNIGPYRMPTDAESESSSDEEEFVGGVQPQSNTDSVIDGVSSHASEPPPLQQDPSEPIPVQQDDLQEAVGSNNLNNSDGAILNEQSEVANSLKSTESSESLIDSSFTEVSPPTQTAMNGNYVEEAAVYGNDEEVPRDVFARFLSWDDRLLLQWSELKNTMYTRLGAWLTQ